MRGHPADRSRLAFLSFFAFAVTALAVFTQHRWGMDPCAWCIVQRMLFLLIGIVTAVGAAWPLRRAGAVHRIAGFIVVLAAVVGAASAMWQTLYASKAASCQMSLADHLVNASRLDRWIPDLFQVKASCADATAPLLGLPYPLWSLAAFVLIAVMTVRVHLDQRHRVVIRDSGGLALG
jgi:protein dithiol:quinone oxidoreductase